MKEYWVWAEYSDERVDPHVLSLLTKARQLADNDTSVCAVVIAESVPSPLLFPGADILRYCQAGGSEGRKGQILAEMASLFQPEVLLFSSGPEETQIAASAAALLDTGLSADCTDLYMESGNLVMHRPAYGGGVTADILCPEHRPQMATVQRGVLLSQNLGNGVPIAVPFVPEQLPEDRITCLARTIIDQTESLREAKIVVSGGLGIGSRADYGLIEDLAAAMHGLPGASRAAVDAGFAPWTRQIGQTGITVYPDLYLAFGISGSVQHIAGMHGARFVAAVNTDVKAPIFSYSDLAVTVDWRVVAEYLLHVFS